ncbi:MAG TPA: hypothetical protein VF609_03255 [Flavisolibacter sp.]|jgi:hypothetical protein
MTLKQFRSLPLHTQEKLLINNGTFLFDRKAVGIKVLLYQLSGFYVEVFYDTTTAKVSLIKSFTDTDGLEAYLYKIDISEVVAILNRA